MKTDIRFNKFSEEQIEYFKNCKYVKKVNDSFVYFNDEFKDELVKAYIEDIDPIRVFEKLNVDFEMYGIKRLRGLMHKIKDKCNGIKKPDKIKIRSVIDKKPLIFDDNLSNLEYNFKEACKKIKEQDDALRYLTQENTYLKKIIAIDSRKEQSCTEISEQMKNSK